jgi:hypothetical protein
LEAVAEAVRVWSCTRNGTEANHAAVLRILARLAALDALPADPAPARGEMVEVAVWEHPDGRITHGRPGSDLEEIYRQSQYWTRLGTARLPLVKGDGA